MGENPAAQRFGALFCEKRREVFFEDLQRLLKKPKVLLSHTSIPTASL